MGRRCEMRSINKPAKLQRILWFADPTLSSFRFPGRLLIRERLQLSVSQGNQSCMPKSNCLLAFMAFAATCSAFSCWPSTAAPSILFRRTASTASRVPPLWKNDRIGWDCRRVASKALPSVVEEKVSCRPGRASQLSAGRSAAEGESGRSLVSPAVFDEW